MQGSQRDRQLISIYLMFLIRYLSSRMSLCFLRLLCRPFALMAFAVIRGGVGFPPLPPTNYPRNLNAYNFTMACSWRRFWFDLIGTSRKLWACCKAGSRIFTQSALFIIPPVLFVILPARYFSISSNQSSNPGTGHWVLTWSPKVFFQFCFRSKVSSVMRGHDEG